MTRAYYGPSTPTRATTPADAVRAILEDREPEDRCAPGCPGWGVFESDSRGIEIERCDECCAYTGITDHDVAQLPEARKALAEFLREHTFPRDSDTGSAVKRWQDFGRALRGAWWRIRCAEGWGA